MSGDNAQQLLKVYGSQVNEELEKIFNTPLERIIDSSPSEHAILALSVCANLPYGRVSGSEPVWLPLPMTKHQAHDLAKLVWSQELPWN